MKRKLTMIMPVRAGARASGLRRMRPWGSIPSLALGVLIAAGCGSGDEADAGTMAETGDEPAAASGTAPVADAALERQMGLMNELRDIDAALAPIRTSAQEDPEIRGDERELMALVDRAMEEVRPGVLEERTRFETLRQEYLAAQREGDRERLEALEPELQELQNGIQEAQNAALRQQEVAEAVEEFRENLFDWMRASDPQADSLLDRAREITEILEGMAPPPGG